MRLTIAALAELGDVEVVAMSNTARTGPVGLAALRVVPAIHERTRIRNLALAVIRRQPRRYSAARPRRQAALIRPLLSGEYDLVWSFTERAALCLPPELRKVPLVIDLVDYEGDRDVELSSRRKGPAAPIHLNVAKAERWAQRSQLRRMIGHAKLVLVSSQQDVHRSRLSGVEVLANAYRDSGRELQAKSLSAEQPSLLFVGLLSYRPNADGLEWLLSDVWPEILRTCPTAQLRVVGRGMDSQPWPLAQRVLMVGEVETMDDELEMATTLVVPIRIGSGTRVKILEAWSHGIPVVSTAKAAEGLGAEDGRHLLFAESPREFAVGVDRVHRDPLLRRSLISNGRALFDRDYSEEAFRRRVAEIAAAATRPRDHDVE
jgi:glycosyltransferase involved in cell wall biosynthesis